MPNSDDDLQKQAQMQALAQMGTQPAAVPSSSWMDTAKEYGGMIKDGAQDLLDHPTSPAEIARGLWNNNQPLDPGPLPDYHMKPDQQPVPNPMPAQQMPGQSPDESLLQKITALTNLKR